jgi:hypothetical protein
VYLWVDPVYQIVGAYFSIMPVQTPGQEQWYTDLFVNAVMAAVVD